MDADLEVTADGSWASSMGARNSMRANKRRDTRPELLVRKLLHAAGLRYRVDYPLPFDRRRRADIVFTRRRIAVFIDGCFWHGCPEHYVAPSTHANYWAGKVVRNTTRDADTNERLCAAGWRVLRFWEHESAEEVARSIEAAVKEPNC